MTCVPPMRERRAGVVHLLDTLDGGGTERGLVRLLSALPRGRLRHGVITMRSAGAAARLLPSDVSCLPLEARGRARFLGLRLAWRLRNDNVRILHARGLATWADAMVARLLLPRCQLALGFHGLEHPGPFSRSQLRRIHGGVRLGADFCTVAFSGRDKLVTEAQVPAHRIHVLPNGVDTDRFPPLSSAERGRVRAALGLSAQAFVLTCVASMTAVKDHQTLLDAAARVFAAQPDGRLLLIGDGPERPAVEARIRTLGLENRAICAGTREDVPRLLASSDAFVCSSRSEGMSHAVLEAMAAGLPIVATAVGDNPLLLAQGRAGLLVPPGDAEQLSQAVLRVMRDEPTRTALGRAARKRVEAFSLAGAAQRYAEFYERLSVETCAKATGAPPLMDPPIPAPSC